MVADWPPRRAPLSGGTAPVARVVDDAAERYEALDEEAGEAISEWSQAWRKAYFAAREAGEQPPARPPSPAIEYGAKFLEAAADYAGTDDAVPFLGWVVTSGVEKAHVTSAVATITASTGSETSEPIAPTLPRLARTLGDDEAMRFLDALRAENGIPASRRGRPMPATPRSSAVGTSSRRTSRPRSRRRRRSWKRPMTTC